MDWNNIQYFEESEFDDPLYPGSGENIDPTLVFALDTLRRLTGWPIIVHHKVGGAADMYGEHDHADNSYHLKKMGCKAVDFHFRTTANYRLQYRGVERLGFTGIGVYLQVWHWGERLISIGFHVDLRPKAIIQRWSCRRKGHYVYFL